MAAGRPAHIDPSARVASRVIAVGDPDRARAIAGLLEEPSLESDRRGLLVYTGLWEGAPVTVATHGMGAPSALIVFEELYMLGARVIVRLGTAGSLAEGLEPGELLVADSAVMARHGCGLDAYSPHLTPVLSPDLELTLDIYRELSSRGERARLGPVFCSDSFYAESYLAGEAARIGALAVEMEAAALFALARIRGFRAAAAFVVSNRVGGGFAPRDVILERSLQAARSILGVLARY